MDVNGILPLWKEKGMTSHDCVFKLRKILKTKKVGHTGTLDPEVDGVLPICIGSATKVAQYLTDAGKSYRAEVTLGYSTDTEDATGERLEEDLSEKTVTRQMLLSALNELTGEIVQIPPMYSAVKVNGRKLYEYARKGIAVERPKRTVTVHSIRLLDENEVWKGPLIRFAIDIDCSKGTYIRTLAVQIGEALGYPAHMSRLTRTRSGQFTETECLTLTEVEKATQDGTLREALKPLRYALTEFPSVELNEADLFAVKNGQVLDQHPLLSEHPHILFTVSDEPLALYKRHPEKQGKMKPEKMFVLSGKEEK